jgi:hypothetical protein
MLPDTGGGCKNGVPHCEGEFSGFVKSVFFFKRQEAARTGLVRRQLSSEQPGLALRPAPFINDPAVTLNVRHELHAKRLSQFAAFL